MNIDDNQVDQVDHVGGAGAALDAIAGEAARLEGEQEQQQQPATPEPGPLEAHAWAQIPMMVGGLLAMALPEVADAYTPDACLRWGEGMAAVANKYGWEAGETMAKYAPEIALTMASVPLVLPVVKAIKARKEAAESKAPRIEDAAAQAGAEPMREGAPLVEVAS
jgi:hypothetical protein